MVPRMLINEVGSRAVATIRNFFPLFRYLVLQTETHAFCLALACAALIGFYPACLVTLTVLKNVLHWEAAYNVLINTLGMYYPAPTRSDFLVTNLGATLSEFGRRNEITSLIWVLLGAAGIFVPLETGFNRLWQVPNDRPYWLNQLVGLALTVGCVLTAILFVSVSTGLHFVASFLPVDIVRQAVDAVIIRITTTCFLIVTLFAFYKFLPNKRIRSKQVIPAAILAGIMAEIVRVVFISVLPLLSLQDTQGPYVVSVSFVLLAYFETFVVLGGAFLASQTDRYPWMGFLLTKRNLPPS